MIVAPRAAGSGRPQVRVLEGGGEEAGGGGAAGQAVVSERHAPQQRVNALGNRNCVLESLRIQRYQTFGLWSRSANAVHTEAGTSGTNRC